MSDERRIDRLEEELGRLIELHSGGQPVESFYRYRNDPGGFCEEVLKANLYDKQKAIALLVRDRDRVLVKGCNGSGKDYLMSRLALWFAFTRPNAKVLLTAPTADQLDAISLEEMRRAFVRDLPGELRTRGLRIGNRRVIEGKTAVEVSKLSGYHDVEVLCLLAEGQGLDDITFEAAAACAIGPNDRIVAYGNPLRPLGPFWKYSRSKGWAVVTIAAADTPNIQQGRIVIPGLISAEGVERLREQGENIYQARVLAEFPEEAEESLFKRAWIDEAMRYGKAAELQQISVGQRTTFGIDVARFGADETVIAEWRGPILRKLHVWHGADLMVTTGRIVQLLNNRRIHQTYSTGRPSKSWLGGEQMVLQGADIAVDVVGLGSGVVDRLRELGWHIHSYNSSARPPHSRDAKQFLNHRASTHFMLRDALEKGEIALCHDEMLVEELMALSWTITSAGKKQIVSKDEVRSLIGRSCDRSDAVVIGFSRAGRVTSSTAPVKW